MEAVTRELRQAGVTYQIEHGGKHLKIRYTLNGRSGMYVVAVSTSDWRAHKRARAGIRRLLRQAATDEART